MKENRVCSDMVWILWFYGANFSSILHWNVIMDYFYVSVRWIVLTSSLKLKSRGIKRWRMMVKMVMKLVKIDFKLFEGFCRQTDKRTDGRTFVNVESLLRLKISLIFVTIQSPEAFLYISKAKTRKLNCWFMTQVVWCLMENSSRLTIQVDFWLLLT